MPSASHVRTRRDRRSDSFTSMRPRSVQLMVVKRNSVRSSSAGWPANGAASATTLSRCATVTFRSPLSSASAQTTVAGAVGFHLNDRGPVTTPLMGTVSAIGRSTSVRASAPSRVHRSYDVGKSSLVTMREYGCLMRCTRMNAPSGDGVASAITAGAPTAVTARVVASTLTSCAVA